MILINYDVQGLSQYPLSGTVGRSAVEDVPKFQQNPERYFYSRSALVYEWSANIVHSGHRKGELTVFTGPTGVGKTTLLSQLSLDFAAQGTGWPHCWCEVSNSWSEFHQTGVRTLWGNFEIKNTFLAQKMLLQHAGKKATTWPITLCTAPSYDRSASGKSLNDLQDKEKWDQAVQTFSELPLYWMRFHGSTTVNEVLDAMEYSVYVHDVEHVILDNLQFMLRYVLLLSTRLLASCSSQSTCASGQAWGSDGIIANKFDIQDRALEEFRRFASTKNVHITLVIHPRKTEDDRTLNIASVFGSVKGFLESCAFLHLVHWLTLCHRHSHPGSRQRAYSPVQQR